MALPTPKELKQLAKTCRAAGIKHFRSGDIEFTLADAAPTSKVSKSKAKTQHNDIDSADVLADPDAPKGEDLLFWSVPTIPLADLQPPGEETTQ